MLLARPMINLMPIVAIAFMWATATGCQQNQEAANNPSGTPATSEQESDSSTSKEVGAKAAESKPKTAKTLDELSIIDLLRKGENALLNNRIDDAQAVMRAARSRDDANWQVKLEIARILYATGEMKEAVSIYDEIVEAMPKIKPRLWQRGLALYYADQFEKGVDQFESHQTFNSQDVENAVWHLLCKAKVTSLKEAREGMIQIDQDSRIPMKQVFDMFAGTGSPEEVLEACNYDPEIVKPKSEIYHGLFYVGLFHEMMGDDEASKNSMREALKYKPLMRGLMGHVAEGHLRARKAYPADQVKE